MYYKMISEYNHIVIYIATKCQYIIIADCGVKRMKNEPLVIKKRGEDGTKIITVRIKEDTLTKIDRLAAEVNYSRNELINVILSHGIKNIEIE